MTLSKENLQFIEDYDTVEPGEAAAMARELLALRERAEPVYYGPYTPVMMGAGVWVSIADELPPHLEGREVWVTTAPPAPVVPETVPESLKDKLLTICDLVEDNDEYCQDIWNACRAAMLKGAEPVRQHCTLHEGLAAIRNSGIAIDANKIQAERDALNALDVPDGWALVPVEPTQEMIDAHVEGVQSGGMQKGYRAMLAAAPAPGKEG